MSLLFLICLAGLFIAVFQDFKRREIDDWLNILLFFSGLGFIFISQGFSSLSQLGFFILIGAIFSLLFYHGRFFAGGDAKLLFALLPLFFSGLLIGSLINLIIFIAFLFLSGSIYSLFFAGFLFLRDFKQIKKHFSNEFNKKHLKIIILIGVLFLFASFIDVLFLIFGLFCVIFVFLFISAKCLEKVSMKKEISTKDLREGDWLFEDVKIGKKTFFSSWDGLTASQVKYLHKLNRPIFIKDGIPFAPAFLFALILFYFKNYLFSFFF